MNHGDAILLAVRVERDKRLALDHPARLLARYFLTEYDPEYFVKRADLYLSRGSHKEKEPHGKD